MVHLVIKPSILSQTHPSSSKSGQAQTQPIDEVTELLFVLNTELDQELIMHRTTQPVYRARKLGPYA